MEHSLGGGVSGVGGSSGYGLEQAVPVGVTRHAPVSPGEEQDRRGGEEAGGGEADEHVVPAVDSQCSDQEAAGQPQAPGSRADPGRAVLFGQMAQLGQVGDDRQPDPDHPHRLEHGLHGRLRRRRGSVRIVWLT